MSLARPRGVVDVSWSRRDVHRPFTFLALVGVAIAVAMAIYGLPPVDLHGPLHPFGIMDPLCGGTRAARYTTQGEWALAWTYNPLGIVSVLGAAIVTVRAAIGVLARRWLTIRVRWTRSGRRLAFLAIVVLLIILEVRQQLRADLLMNGTLTF